MMARVMRPPTLPRAATGRNLVLSGVAGA
jgi:hypothetical protein